MSIVHKSNVPVRGDRGSWKMKYDPEAFFGKKMDTATSILF